MTKVFRTAFHRNNLLGTPDLRIVWDVMLISEEGTRENADLHYGGSRREKTVFCSPLRRPPLNMVLMEISRSRLSNQKLSAKNMNLCRGVFCKFWGDFWVCLGK